MHVEGGCLMLAVILTARVFAWKQLQILSPVSLSDVPLSNALIVSDRGGLIDYFPQSQQPYQLRWWTRQPYQL